MSTFSEDLVKRMEELKDTYVGCGKPSMTRGGDYESSEPDEVIFSEEEIDMLCEGDNTIDDYLQYAMYPCLDQYNV